MLHAYVHCNNLQSIKITMLPLGSETASSNKKDKEIQLGLRDIFALI